MVFASNSFFVIFLPLFLLIYFVLPFRYRSFLSPWEAMFFFGWWQINFIALIDLLG
ncbi:MAG: hypothetical protein R2865_11460 [Deinococcales bacterium]